MSAAGSIDRRFGILARSGLTATDIAWALDRSVEEVEARLGARRDPADGAEEPVMAARETAIRRQVFANDNRRAAIHAATPRRRIVRPPSPARLALKALGARAAEIDESYRLDGAPATLRDLVLAAAELGVTIPYPNLIPLPGIYHTGPSGSGGPARKHARRRPSLPTPTPTKDQPAAREKSHGTTQTP